MTRALSCGSASRPRQRGFTLLEVLAAISIVGLLLAVTVPASVRFYESMQYRQALRDVITALASARYRAVNSGQAQDVAVDPLAKTIELNGERTRLPDEVNVVVHSARELNRERLAVIRFYPEGGSSGGDIDLERRDGSGVRISIDWLVGRVSQETYVVN